MAQTRMKNFRLPLDLCEALEKDKRKQIDIVRTALTKELGLEPKPVMRASKVAKREFEERVEQLSKTLPPESAKRIALLEMT